MLQRNIPNLFMHGLMLLAKYGNSLWDFAQATEQKSTSAMNIEKKKVMDALDDSQNKFLPSSSAVEQCTK